MEWGYVIRGGGMGMGWNGVMGCLLYGKSSDSWNRNGYGQGRIVRRIDRCGMHIATSNVQRRIIL